MSCYLHRGVLSNVFHESMIRESVFFSVMGLQSQCISPQECARMNRKMREICTPVTTLCKLPGIKRVCMVLSGWLSPASCPHQLMERKERASLAEDFLSHAVNNQYSQTLGREVPFLPENRLQITLCFCLKNLPHAANKFNLWILERNIFISSCNFQVI